MKKIISLTLALALILSLSIPAFAADLGGSQDVTAKYEKTEVDSGEIRSVELKWGDLTFTYSETTTKTWNPNTHKNDENTTGGWDKTESTITVINHSNVALDVSMSVTPVAGTGVNVSLTGGNATLAAGEVGNVEGADSVTGKLTISGTPNDTVTETGIKVASVTVTIE